MVCRRWIIWLWLLEEAGLEEAVALVGLELAQVCQLFLELHIPLPLEVEGRAKQKT
jgi:hypothetical protein